MQSLISPGKEEPSILFPYIYNEREKLRTSVNQSVVLNRANAESGRLTWGGTDFRYGMYGERDADNPNLYRFVDDGRREEATTGMILWGQPGEYRAYGESRFAHITLLKHD